MNKSVTIRIRIFYIVLFVMIFVIGSFLHLPNQDQSLWLDEAWVANSVLS